MSQHFAERAEVAVMPLEAKSASEVVGIIRVKHVGHIFVQTDDGGLYAASDGADLRGQRRIAFAQKRLPPRRRVQECRSRPLS